MIIHPGLFPITVIVAAVIFLLKEILEAIRRSLANRRKKEALRSLLAIECERNQWVIKWMKDRIPDILRALQDGRNIEVRRTAAGYDRLAIANPRGEASAPIPHVRNEVINKYLFDAASIDAAIFRKMEEAGAGLAVLSHLREGLIEHVAEDREWLDGWAEYAKSELEDVEAAVAALYKICTKREVTPHRVR